MLSPAVILLIAALLPLAGFLLLLFIGRQLGAPLAGWVGTVFLTASFAVSLLAMVKWYSGNKGQDPWGMGERPILRTIAWLPAGGGIQQSHGGFLDVGVYVDSLTIGIFATVTLVAVILHIYSIGFMRREEHFARLFMLLGLHGFATLGLVIGATLLHILAFWQILSLSSALLIGFPFDRPQKSNAAVRAYLFQVVGDCGLLIGFGILFCKLGNVTLPSLWTLLGNAAGGQPVVLANGETFSTGLLTLTGISLFFGAIAKSAQFPLQVWVADAAAAPIPASATICTATTTLAGVYLIGRLFPILTPEARLFIAIIGLVTLIMGAGVAMAQDDLRRMLVWTAVGQFGYMMLAMGVGSWSGGLFHVMTSSFSIALLFLAVGSVTFCAGGEQRMSRLGGMWRNLPITGVGFGIAVLAISGAHLLSGYYSASMIAADAAAFASYACDYGGRSWGYWLFFALPTATAYLTAFYLTRCWMLIFAGTPADPERFKHAHEQPMLIGPMLALAVPTLIAGYAMNVPDLLRWARIEMQTLCDDMLAPGSSGKGNKFTAFDQAWPLLRPPVAEPNVSEPAEGLAAPSSPAARAHERGHTLARIWAAWAWLVGIAAAAGMYWNGSTDRERYLRYAPLGWIHGWLRNEMYFDELYYWTVARLTAGLALTCWAIDRYLVSGIVDGLAQLTRAVVGQFPLKKK